MVSNAERSRQSSEPLKPLSKSTVLLKWCRRAVRQLSKTRRPDLATAPMQTSCVPVPSSDLWTYGIDIWQRSVLFWDVLRRRADIMMEHEQAGMPPVLTFDYETLLDARRFERPANYALLRITAVGEDRAERCVDCTKPPVIVIDSRAGHGPALAFQARLRSWDCPARRLPGVFCQLFPGTEPASETR